MRRLYYVVDNIGTTSAISEHLHAEGIKDWNFHVLSKDRSELYTHNLHSASPLHTNDSVRTGERRGLVGGCIGLLTGLGLHFSQILPWYFDRFSVFTLIVIGALLGALQGCIAGARKENYKITEFHDEIESGRYLIMLDVPAGEKAAFRELMSLQFPDAAYRGNDSITISPLTPKDRIRPGAGLV